MRFSASLKPFKAIVAGVETDSTSRIVRVFPMRKGDEDSLPDSYFMDGGCVVKDRDSGKPLFNGSLSRVSENKLSLALKWTSGREIVIGDELLIFPPDYLKGLIDWSSDLTSLPSLCEELKMKSWPDDMSATDVIPLLPVHIHTLRERQQQSLGIARKKIGLIWGPPGTGKTFTVGVITLAHILQGRKVLALGPTNRSVNLLILETDNAVRGAGGQLRDGSVLRLGYPQHLEFDSPDRKHLLRFQTRLEDIGQEIKGKRAELETFSKAAEEDPSAEAGTAAAKELIQCLETERNNLLEQFLPKAQLVATTLASLLARTALWNQHWDVVILDESSLVFRLS